MIGRGTRAQIWRMIEPASNIDVILRLLSATGTGMALGLNRDMRGKPTGMRTLGLVSLGAATVSLAGLQIGALVTDPNALSRVVQGIFQGVLTGVGFIGAGVILHMPDSSHARGLTTAAMVWVTAALGVACAFGQWVLVAAGLVIALAVLFLLRGADRHLLARALAKRRADPARHTMPRPPQEPPPNI